MTRKEYDDLKVMCARTEVALSRLSSDLQEIKRRITSSYYNQPDDQSKVVPIDSELLFIKMIP